MKFATRTSLVALVAGACLAPAAFASFHVMQIEQVMLSYDGDNTVQAIQLRMRTSFQNQVQLARIRAFDATGANPIVIVNMAAFAINQAQPWLYYLPLPFLFWLMLTGLYMFVQPYLLRRRSGGAT